MKVISVQEFVGLEIVTPPEGETDQVKPAFATDAFGFGGKVAQN